MLEGPDGVGKTTLAKGLVESLAKSGFRAKLLSFPGQEAATIGAVVYRLHHDPKSWGLNPLDPAVLQALHIAAHLDAIKNRILPALADGQYVVLDRYWWSAFVYGLQSGVDAALLKAIIEIEKHAWGGVLPTCVFLLSRSSPANASLPQTEFDALARSYRKVAIKEERRYRVVVINTENSVDQSLQQILTALDTPPHANTIAVEDCARPSLFARIDRTAAAEPGLPVRSGPQHSSPEAVSVFRGMRAPVPTTVYDTYWRFAAERQEIFFRRFSGSPPPWTCDPILLKYKFTNAYRASDRVSQYLTKDVIYQGDQAPEEVFFRVLIFKLFNKIETWKLLVRKLGSISWAEFAFDRYDRALTQAITNGVAIYSAAYIMPSGAKGFGTTRKHRTHLMLLERMMKDKLALRLMEARRMLDAFKLLRSYPMIGDFLAYQYVTDINYSSATRFSEMEFVVPGPGARSGIRKCFESLGELTEADTIKRVAENQEREFERLHIDFKTLWGRPLQLIDCQNLFCEVDKYARVKHPDLKGVPDRSRIKQRFHPNLQPIRYWFPPKWGLNDRIESRGVTGTPDANLRR